MNENTNNVTWTIIEGEGNFGEQTDTSIVFVPFATGKVVIEAKEGELSSQKTLWVNSLTSVFHISKTRDVKVFPNPVSKTLYFQLESLQFDNFQIKVFNLLGEQLLEQNFTIGSKGISKFKINTSVLKTGVYFYAIFIDAEVKFGKFIKFTEH